MPYAMIAAVSQTTGSPIGNTPRVNDQDVASACHRRGRDSQPRIPKREVAGSCNVKAIVGNGQVWPILFIILTVMLSNGPEGLEYFFF